MCSVLADHTVEDMWQFLRDNGTKGEYIRENSTGVQAWIDMLKSDISIPQDQRPLELASRMCAIEPQKRPMAREVLSMILNFDGPVRYYGLCCDELHDVKDRSHQTIQTDSSYEAKGLLSESMRTEEYHEADSSLPFRNRYHFPTVGDPTEDLTVQAFFPPGGVARKHVLEDAELPGATVESRGSTNPSPPLHVSQSILPRPTLDHSLRQSVSPGPATNNPVSKVSIDDPPSRMMVLDLIENLDLSQLPCPWPQCSHQSRFDSHKSLVDHLRHCHGTHELFWTPLLSPKPIVSTRETSSQWIPGQIILESAISNPPDQARAFVMKRDVVSPRASTDPYADHLRSRVMAMRENLGHAKPFPSHLVPEASTTSLPPPRSMLDRGRSERVCGSTVQVNPLPEARLPKTPISVSHNDEPEVLREPVITPDRISEPSISCFNGGDSQPGAKSVPRSSLVPSYYLAATNCLSRGQIQSMLTIRKPVPTPPPLFVYGSLMFPSVLRAQAERSISAEGIYSKALQRRIQTSAEDWNNMNQSLRRTAQQMTPALLRGYLRRFKVESSEDAALVHWPIIKEVAIAETKGFLISGLAYEALMYLDYVFSPEGYDGRDKWSAGSRSRRSNRAKDRIDSSDSSDTDSASDNDNATKSVWPGQDLHRKAVVVTISDSKGNPQIIEAQTYVCRHVPHLQTNAWDLNEFVKHKTFDDLSTSIKSDRNAGYDLVAEETTIASELGMLYAMPGDELCDRILKNDVEGVYSLISNGTNVDGSCRHYGTPLQAAAAKGYEKLVYVMLRFWKADANKQGGRYNSPLVAAICNGHEDVVHTLLRHGASPIAGAGSFVSPVYQAVSFEDVGMTHVLLERGAWLSKDYIELLDLAKEIGNIELCELMRRYDIRNLHKASHIEEDHNRKQQKSKDKVLSHHSDGLGLRDLMPAFVEVFRLKGQRGKWTGIKAIQVLRVAYGDNVPNDVLNLLGANLETMQKLLMILLKHGTPTSGLREQEDETSNEHHLKFNHPAGNASWDFKYSPRNTEPSPQGAPRLAQRKGREPNTAVNDVFCLTCDGRGGRKGTGRRCERCHGKGTGSSGHSLTTTDSKEGQSQVRCRACNGTGNIFSERDKCRACNYGGEQQEEGNDQRRYKDMWGSIGRRIDLDHNKSERRREHLDPPPPYPGRS